MDFREEIKDSTGQGITYEGMARNQVALLEELFNDKGLSKLRKSDPQHPAVARHSVFSKFSKGNFSIARARSQQEIIDVCSALLEFQCGSREGVRVSGWEDVKDNWRTQCLSHDKFHDFLAAHEVGSTLEARGLTAKLVEQEGQPDLCIEYNKSEFWAEVKHLSPTATENTINTLVKKANKQLKGVGGGLLFVKLALNHISATPSDQVPPEATAAIDFLRRRMLSPENRSIAKCVVFFHYVTLMDSPGKYWFYFDLRRSIVLDRRKPVDLGIPQDKLPLDATIEQRLRMRAFSIRVPSESVQYKQIIFGDAFRSGYEHSAAIPQAYIWFTLDEPDDSLTFLSKGVSVHLYMKKFEAGNYSYWILLITTKVAAGEFADIVLRVPIAPVGFSKGATCYDVFREALNRYGWPFLLDGTTSYFSEASETKTPPSMKVSKDVDTTFHSRIMKREDGCYEAIWSFGFNRQAYIEDLKRLANGESL